MRALKRADIAREPADALIYSTNVLLNCTGGVGGALMARYGRAIQDELQALLKKSGRRSADRGELFDLVPAGMPYRHLIHALPCDAWYDTAPEIVDDVLRRGLDICAADPEVQRVAVSALGTGYGHLALEDFLRLAARAFQDERYASIREIVLCVEGGNTFDDARAAIESEGLPLEVLEPESSD